MNYTPLEILPVELWLIILNFLFLIDPNTFFRTIPQISNQMRTICISFNKKINVGVWNSVNKHILNKFIEYYPIIRVDEEVLSITDNYVFQRKERGEFHSKYPILYEACQHCHTNTVYLLLRSNADPDCATFEERTPLHESCERGHPEICQLLLNFHADVNKKSLTGDTPLLKACSRDGNLEIVEMLIDREAEFDPMDHVAGGALFRACKWNKTEIVEFLLERRAHPNRIENYCSTPLLVACSYGYIDTVKLLIKNGSPHMSYFFGQDAVKAAGKRQDIVDLLTPYL